MYAIVAPLEPALQRRPEEEAFAPLCCFGSRLLTHAGVASGRRADPAFVAQLEARASQMWASGRYAAWSFEGHAAEPKPPGASEARCGAVELLGCVVASACTDMTARLWDARSCKNLRIIPHPAVRPLRAETQTRSGRPAGRQLSPSGPLAGAQTVECVALRAAHGTEDVMLATGDAEGWLRVWAGGTGECLHELQQHAVRQPAVRTPESRHDSRAVGSSHTAAPRPMTGQAAARALRWLGGGAGEGAALLSAAADGAVAAWGVGGALPSGGGARAPCKKEHAHTEAVCALALQRGGGGKGAATLAATASEDRTLKLWSLDAAVRGGAPECTRTLKGHAGGESVPHTCSGCGARPACRRGHKPPLGPELTWGARPREGRAALHPGRHAGAVRGIAVEGDLLVSGSEDCSIRVWSLYAGRTPQPPAPRSSPGLAEEGRRPLRLTRARAACRDSSSGQCVENVTAKGRPVLAVALAGHLLASAGRDGIITVWDLHPRQGGAQLQVVTQLAGARERIYSLAMTASRIISAGSACAPRLWEHPLQAPPRRALAAPSPRPPRALPAP